MSRAVWRMTCADCRSHAGSAERLVLTYAIAYLAKRQLSQEGGSSCQAFAAWKQTKHLFSNVLIVFKHGVGLGLIHRTR